MLYIKNKLCLQYSELVPVIFKKTNYDYYKANDLITIHGTGGNGRTVYIEYESMPKKQKEAVYNYYGCPYSYVCKQPLLSQIAPDPEAERFFSSYVLPNGSKLPNSNYTLNGKLQINYVRRYTECAQWLNMIIKMTSDKRTLKKELNITMSAFWDAVIDLIKVRKVDLPKSGKRLREKVKGYQQNSYGYLVETHKFGNSFSTKILGDLAKAFLHKLLSLDNLHSDVTIDMPESYKTTAEALIKKKTQEHAEKNRLAVIFDLDVDPRYLRRQQIVPVVGMQLTVQSDNLGINKLIEINQVTKPLVDPYDVRLVLSNTTVISEADRNLEIIKEAPKRLNEVQRQTIEQNRQEILRKRRHSVTLSLQGQFDPNKKYTNTNNRQDVVINKGIDDDIIFWFYIGQHNVAGEWNIKNWFPFEGNFESIATNTLLAENASIADWTMKNGKITSQAEQQGIPNMILNGKDGVIKMSGLNEVGYRQKSELRDEGSFLESGGMALEEYTSLWGTRITASNTSVLKNSVPNVTGEFPNRVQNVLTAYYGRAINDANSDPAVSYGGYFDDLRADGLNLGIGGSNNSTNVIIGGGRKVESLYLFGNLFQDTIVNFEPSSGIREFGKLVIIHNQSYTNKVIVKKNNINPPQESDLVLNQGESAFFFGFAFWERLGILTETEIRTIANQVYT